MHGANPRPTVKAIIMQKSFILGLLVFTAVALAEERPAWMQTFQEVGSGWQKGISNFGQNLLGRLTNNSRSSELLEQFSEATSNTASQLREAGQAVLRAADRVSDAVANASAIRQSLVDRGNQLLAQAQYIIENRRNVSDAIENAAPEVVGNSLSNAWESFDNVEVKVQEAKQAILDAREAFSEGEGDFEDFSQAAKEIAQAGVAVVMARSAIYNIGRTIVKNIGRGVNIFG